MLAFYQLWLDDLYPKAQFLDALAMVEKMGHKKKIITERMNWINEGKPKSVHQDSLFDEPVLPPREYTDAEARTRIAPVFQSLVSQRPKTPDLFGDDDEDDIYGATPKRATQPRAGGSSNTDSVYGGAQASLFGPARVVDDGPPEDDLDALMAESEALLAGTENPQPSDPKNGSTAQEDDFDDDMEAMAEMEMDM